MFVVPLIYDDSIVAVHDFGGQGFSSWTTRDSKAAISKPWLEELLGADMPNARIMAFGYISSGISLRNLAYGRALRLAKVLAALREQDHTDRRPLFFIAHGLGGWIVKLALIISSEAADPDLEDIELSTSGAAFFGTPLPGPPSLTRLLSPPLSHITQKAGSTFSDGIGLPSADSLQPEELNASDLEWLEYQIDTYKAIAVNLASLSFFGTKKTRDGNTLEPNDFIAGSDGVRIGLQITHSELIRFHGRDANYQIFLDKFRDMMHTSTTSGLLESKKRAFDFSAGESLARRVILNSMYHAFIVQISLFSPDTVFQVNRLESLSSQGYSIPSNKLPDDSSSVIARQGLLEQLAHMISRDADPLVVDYRIFCIWGSPGTGKTALARSYVEKNRGNFSFVFWIRAESWLTAFDGYLELAHSIVEHYAKDASRSEVEKDLGFSGLEDMHKTKDVLQLDIWRMRSVIQAVKDWLMCPDNIGWLLVFDNVEPSCNIIDFIPALSSGNVILTSRDKNCCRWGRNLGVGAMNEKEAISLLQVVSEQDTMRDPRQGERFSRKKQTNNNE